MLLSVEMPYTFNLDNIFGELLRSAVVEEEESCELEGFELLHLEQFVLVEDHE